MGAVVGGFRFFGCLAFWLLLFAQFQSVLAFEHRTAGIGEPQSAMSLRIDVKQTPGDQLTVQPPPLGSVEFIADAVSADLIVTKTLYPVVGLAQQHIDQVADAEALAGAVHTGERLLRRHRGVPCLRRGEAGIAVAAGFIHLVAEVGQQRLAAAAGELAVAQHALQLLCLDAFVRLIRI